MLGWFRALLPREDKFFDLFERHSRILVLGAEALQELLEGGDNVELHCRKIVELEHQADEITREVMLAVRKSFITPFDRGDIKDLIQSMDDAIDMMHKIVKIVTLFEQKDFDPRMREMGAAIVEAAQADRRGDPAARQARRQRHASQRDRRRDHQGRGALRRAPRRRAEGPAPAPRQDRCDGLDHRQRDLRRAGEGGRPVRGRRQ